MGVSFSGMASGLDTDSIVKAMLYNQQSKIDNKYREQVTLTYKQEVWSDVNKKMQDFYTNYVDSLKYQYTFKKYKATASSSAISVTAGENAALGTHNFTVEQLAEGAQAVSRSIAGTSVTENTKLADLGVLGNTTLAVTAADGSVSNITIDVTSQAGDTTGNPPKATTIGELADILATKGVNLSIGISANEESQITISGDPGIKLQGGVLKKLGMSESTIETTNSTVGKAIGTIGAETNLVSGLGITAGSQITLNGAQITIEASDTISTLTSKLKAADSSLNVSFDDTSKSFLISTKSTGESSMISIGGDSNTLAKLGLTAATTMGKNAKYTYNGTALESETNTVSVNGLTATFNAVTDTNGNGIGDASEKVNVAIGQDTEGIVDYISKFVDAYNDLIKDLNDLYNAKKCKYEPFSESEEEEATDEQKEKREEAVKKSVLRKDDTLYDILNSMRSSLYANVADNKYGSLAGIGITTGNYTENGKLYLDKDKLTAALQEDPEAVMNLFTAREGTNAEGKNTTGIGQLLNKQFNKMKAGINNVKSYNSYYNDKSMTSDIDTIKDRITTLRERYESQKKIYMKKFTAMESALAALNSQQSTLSQYFS